MVAFFDLGVFVYRHPTFLFFLFLVPQDLGAFLID